MFNLIFAHLLGKTEHHPDCKFDAVRGPLCAGDCSTARLLDVLDEPLMPWEIEQERHLELKLMQLQQGDIPA